MLRVFLSSVNRKGIATMPTIKKIGVCQMKSTNDKINNRDLISSLVSRSVGKAEFLFFPECCDYVGSSVDETKKLAEPLTGDTVQFYKKIW